MIAVIVVAFGLGCDAERLGVEIPRGGPEVLSGSDIKRDVWRMTDPRIGGRVPGSSGARHVAKHTASRMKEGGLDPAFDSGYRSDLGADVGEMVCGVRRGSGDQAILIASLDPGVGTLSVLPTAGLLSLAPAFQRPQAPMHSLYFCTLPESSGLSGLPLRSPVALASILEVFLIGTLTGPQLLESEGPTVGHVRSRLLHSGELSPDVSDRVGELDYDRIRARLADAYRVVSSVD